MCRNFNTHLFPSTPTWWLVLVLFILNGIDFISFEALNHSNPAITTLPVAQRNIDGLVSVIQKDTVCSELNILSSLFHRKRYRSGKFFENLTLNIEPLKTEFHCVAKG
jgi:hypothetical protein